MQISVNTLREAYRAMIARINAGAVPRDAVADALASFNGDYAQLMADGFSAILARSIGTESVLAMKISGVSLSARLYAQSRETSATVAGLIERHVKGFQDVRQITLDIYEGYGFKDKEAINLSPRNPKLPQYLCKELLTDPGIAGELPRHFTRVQAAGLKTPALRAAYLAAVKAMEQGIGQDVLDKRLRVAFHERMRYFANRIAQTELHRAYADRQAVELMEDTDTAFVRWRMSGTHPKTDICDYFAKVGKFGLGAGIYPKAKAPKGPAHPFCRCILIPLTGLPASTKWKERKGADQEWLKAQGLNEGASIMGSKARRDAVLKGADPIAVHNSRSDPLYRVATVGSVDASNWPLAMQPGRDVAGDVLRGDNVQMQKLPRFEDAEIQLIKIKQYALNDSHPTGAHKARVFKAALGFNESHAQDVADQVKQLLPTSPAKLGALDKHGQRYAVDMTLTGPTGSANVRSAWIVAKEGAHPRLVSIYVKES